MLINSSESTSIPVNPRTNRPVGYAFVDLKSADEAEKAITNLSGKDILERKVSVQLARKPEETTKKVEGDADKRQSTRGRGGRGRARGGRARGARGAGDAATTDLAENPLPLTDVTNEANQATTGTDGKPRAPRPVKQRGPPEDGIPSTNKVMVANLPYDLTEEKVSDSLFATVNLTICSSRNSSMPTSPLPPRLLYAPSLDSWSRSFRLVARLARAVVSASSPLAAKSSSRRLSLR
jgi:RNA recognition motif-containing protein